MNAQLPALTLEELTTELGSRTRGLALLRWLWSQPTLPRELPERIEGVSHREWAKLRAKTEWRPPEHVAEQQSADGTTKLGLRFGGDTIESVRIPSNGRITVCLSSQSGCTRKCAFCATQTLGFRRHLTSAEMIFQFMLAGAGRARNVVFMGMGEPMDNLDNVLRAVKVLTQSPAPQLRAQSVTVSTSGVLPGMVRFLAESKASLALSLNATTDETRAQLMPHTRTWPISALLGALKDDAKANPRREHFIEYVLFAGVNDTDADTERLAQLLDGVPSRLNLIPHNPFPGSPYLPPTDERVLAFHERMVKLGVLSLVRWPKGREIAAACGQLALAKQTNAAA
ncbi:MAG: 23S rRNA (adenine(2503)-C(2))-methyltransferase RlmN [Myxococcaceae bacterium]|nr:23S rRNA (adenine(2503)-C(2))-methyltransferase RlmN [Myxococcaceae bacterium]